MRLLNTLAIMTTCGTVLWTACGSSSDGKSSEGKGGGAGEGAAPSGGKGGSAGAAGSGGKGGTTNTGGKGGSAGSTSTGGSSQGGASGGGEGGEGGEGGAGASGGEGGSGTTPSRALRFAGDDDLLSLPTASGAANEAAYSIELWFRTMSATGMLFEVFGSGADRSLYVSAGKVCFYVYEPTYNEICTTAATYADGQWHHAAGTLGTGGQHLYVDGVPGPSTTVTASAFVADTGFRAGYGYIGPNGPLTYFAGDIDEIRVWSVERSMADIASNRSRSIDPGTSGLQGYWKLDEMGAASTANDSTAAGNDGTLTGFVFTPSPWIADGAF